MSSSYILNPELRLASYANQYFAYDARVTDSPLVEIPTQRLCEEEYAPLQHVKTKGFFLESRTRDDILNYFKEEGFRSELLDTLIDRDFIKPHVSQAELIQNKVLEYFRKRYSVAAQREGPQLPFGDEANLHRFSPKTFFNLPRSIDPAYCHVGLLGFPHASLNASLGTEGAPGQLRLHSRSLCWFDIYQHGVYSEIAIEQGRPEILCKNVVLCDVGDLGLEDMAVKDMVVHVGQVLDREYFRHGVCPLILGGDHAITYPIVLAHLAERPQLGLLHLDAHNDLFYTPQVVHSHAAPISNLLKRSSIQRIVSLGLRTFSDKRVGALQSLYQVPETSQRICLYTLTSLKQLIMNPAGLMAELRRWADRPYYLTLDLDVLSEDAIGRQLSTPFGSGLEWHELFYFLDMAFRTLTIIGCDVVEYNSAHGENRGQHRYLLNSLLLLLIDRLAKGNPKFRQSGQPEDSGTVRVSRAGEARQ